MHDSRIIFSPIPILAVIILSAFWIWMLVDALRRQFPDNGSKIAWVLVILLGQGLGALVYCFVVYDGPEKRLGAWLSGTIAILVYAILGPAVARSSGVAITCILWILGGALIIGLLLLLRRGLRRQP